MLSSANKIANTILYMLGCNDENNDANSFYGCSKNDSEYESAELRGVEQKFRVFDIISGRTTRSPKTNTLIKIYVL